MLLSIRHLRYDRLDSVIKAVTYFLASGLILRGSRKSAHSSFSSEFASLICAYLQLTIMHEIIFKPTTRCNHSLRSLSRENHHDTPQLKINILDKLHHALNENSFLADLHTPFYLLTPASSTVAIHTLIKKRKLNLHC